MRAPAIPILLCIIALAGMAPPVNAEVILDRPSLTSPRPMTGNAVRPWFISHDAAVIRCDTAAAAGGMRKGSMPVVHIGGPFGPAMDRTDRACLLHALEWAPERRLVRWTSRQPDEAMYDIVLLRKEDRANLQCRYFQAASVRAGQRQSWRGRACRAADGIWRFT